MYISVRNWRNSDYCYIKTNKKTTTRKANVSIGADHGFGAQQRALKDISTPVRRRLTCSSFCRKLKFSTPFARRDARPETEIRTPEGTKRFLGMIACVDEERTRCLCHDGCVPDAAHWRPAPHSVTSEAEPTDVTGSSLQNGPRSQAPHTAAYMCIYIYR